MIHPSYADLMKVVNSGTEYGDEPVVNSRYSIVIATAKRARQLIAGDEPMIENAAGKKPLSVAVEELNEGKVKILTEEEAALLDEMMENREFMDGGSGFDKASGEEYAFGAADNGNEDGEADEEYAFERDGDEETDEGYEDGEADEEYAFERDSDEETDGGYEDGEADEEYAFERDGDEETDGGYEDGEADEEYAFERDGDEETDEGYEDGEADEEDASKPDDGEDEDDGEPDGE